jgi:hypothetical protein
VTAPAHRNDELVLAREPDGVTDIGDAGASGDETGASIDGAVPHLAVLVVITIIRADELTPKRCLQLIDSTAVDDTLGD